MYCIHPFESSDQMSSTGIMMRPGVIEGNVQKMQNLILSPTLSPLCCSDYAKVSGPFSPVEDSPDMSESPEGTDKDLLVTGRRHGQCTLGLRLCCKKSGDSEMVAITWHSRMPK